MRSGAWIAGMALVLFGCKAEWGNHWSSVTSAESDGAVVRASNAANPEASGGFELDAYKKEQADADRSGEASSDAEDLAAELGAEGVEIPDDPVVAAPSGPPLAPPGYPPVAGTANPPPAAVAPPPPRWTPAEPITLSWGLRLVSTVDGASPPRAILGMPDGTEVVVKAGDLLPDAGVIVLAIGNGVVQLGRVQPSGDHAQVESVFLSAMFEPAPAAP